MDRQSQASISPLYLGLKPPPQVCLQFIVAPTHTHLGPSLASHRRPNHLKRRTTYDWVSKCGRWSGSDSNGCDEWRGGHRGGHWGGHRGGYRAKWLFCTRGCSFITCPS
ncbi:hypothetical protein RSAG8_06714, partial [Rhizoctonia solani AG-8 WAC10335]